MIRLIASDLDGTLLDESGCLPEGTYETVKRLKDCGIRFAACSGRQYSNLRRLFGLVADDMAFVCENGAFSVMDGKEAGLVAFEREEARTVIADMEAHGLSVMVNCKHICYLLDNNRIFTDDIVYRLRNTVNIVHSWDEVFDPILKVAGWCLEGVQPVAPLLSARWGSAYTATVSGFEWFDITVANKGMGMQQLMSHMGVAKEEVAAFGDNFNDESMLDAVGYPFLMQGAASALRKPQYLPCRQVLPVLGAIAEARGDINQALCLLTE